MSSTVLFFKLFQIWVQVEVNCNNAGQRTVITIVSGFTCHPSCGLETVLIWILIIILYKGNEFLLIQTEEIS